MRVSMRSMRPAIPLVLIFASGGCHRLMHRQRYAKCSTRAHVAAWYSSASLFRRLGVEPRCCFHMSSSLFLAVECWDVLGPAHNLHGGPKLEVGPSNQLFPSLTSRLKARTESRPSASITWQRSHSQPLRAPEWMISRSLSMLGVASLFSCTSHPRLPLSHKKHTWIILDSI